VNQAVFHLLGHAGDVIKGVHAGEVFGRVSDVPITTAAGLLTACRNQPERLVNSRSGRIHLFPCVPRNATVAFRGFQARGGFLVSAEMLDGQVAFLEITARRSIPCRVMNPWPGHRVTIRQRHNGAVIEPDVDRENGECLIFAAEDGTTYQLVDGATESA
jgi:hypothetical protein